MIFIAYIIFFLLGFCFAQWVIPFLDTLCGFICTFFEEKKGKIALRMIKIQAAIDSEEASEKSPAIGFDWCCEEEGDEELDD